MNPDPTTTETPVSRCPVYEYRVDHATGAPGSVPKAGDVSLCLACGAINLFAADLTLRRPSAQELRRVQNSGSWPRIRAVITAIRRARRRRR